MPFDGETYDSSRDRVRLKNQLSVVKLYMMSGLWWTLAELAKATDYPESSISARIRDLRKEKFGGYTINRKRVSGGTYAYRMVGGVVSE